MNISPGRYFRHGQAWVLRLLLLLALAAGAFAQAPTITAPPLSKIAVVGQAVSFTVGANGTAPLTYQWKRYGQVVAGATSGTLSVPDASLADRGWYQVAVSGGGGMAESTFTLWVVPAASEAVAWGSNEAGQATVPAGLGVVLGVAVGTDCSVALKADRTVSVWGSNSYGQLAVPAGLSDVVNVAASGYYTVALKADGTMVTWGALASGTPATSLRDAQSIVAVAAGSNHSLALKADGTVSAWGNNAGGQLNTPAGLTNVVAVACGAQHSLALRADGTVVGWGANPHYSYGESTPPVGLSNVVAIAAGSSHSCALKNDGTVVAWGTPNNGVTNVPAGLSSVVGITAANSYTYAVKADGSVTGWGYSYTGSHLPPAGLSAVSAVAVGGGHVVAMVVPPPLAITRQPANQTAFTTADATFSVGIVGMLPLAFQWKRNAVPLSNGTRISGATSDTLVLQAVDTPDEGIYTVTVSDRSGTVSSGSATLSVVVPTTPANDLFANAEPLAGASGTVGGTNVGATREAGEPSHTYYLGPDLVPATVWYAWTVPQSGAVAIDTVGSNFSTALKVYEGTLLSALTERSSLNVRAGTQLRVAVGSATASRGIIRLNWRNLPAPANDDFANAQILPGNVGTVTGDNQTATGEPGELIRYTSGTGSTRSSLWHRWTAPQSGIACFEVTSSFYANLSAYTGTAFANLVCLGQSEDNSGRTPARIAIPVTGGTTYSIAVSGSADNRGSFTLSWQLQTTPTITTAPANQVSAVGGSATFSVTTTGGSPAYQWFHEGVLLPGSTGATLALSSLALADAGSYQVRVSNLAGTVLSPTVTLAGPNPAPVISAQPQDTVAMAGQPSALRVVATGVGSLTYRWRRNSVAITGATSAIYAIGVAARSDADSYDVIVYDGLSATTSSRVRLAVDPASDPGMFAWNAGNDLVPETAQMDPVSLIVPGQEGKIYLAGSFKAIGGRWRSGLARLNADLTLDASFVPPLIDGTIKAIIPLAGGQTWIAGQITTIDGTARGNVARLNADGSLDPTFSAAYSGLSGTINAMALLGDGRLLLGGSLVTQGSGSSVLAVMSLNGTVRTMYPPSTLAYDVYAMAVQPDGKILVGGTPSSNRAPSGNGIARLNANGTVDATFAPVDVVGDTGSVFTIAIQPNGSILVGGNLYNYSGVRVKRLLPSGALDPAFSGNAGFSTAGTVRTLAVQSDGRIIVGGVSLYMANSSYVNLARLNADGGLDPTFESKPNGAVSSALVLPGGGLLVGGSFTWAGAARGGFAKLNSDGTLDSAHALLPRRAGAINALADLPGGATLVAGNFSYLDGVPAANLARINADGRVSTSFNSGQGANGPVYNIVPLSDGRAVLFGDFTTYGGIARSGIARINPDGSLDAAFNAAGSDMISTRVIGRCGRSSRDRILYIAYPSSWGGVAGKVIGALNSDGSRDLSFDVGTGTFGEICAIAGLPDGRVLVGGNFPNFNGQVCNRLVRLNTDGSIDNSFDVGTGVNDKVMAITVLPDGKILLMGSFTICNGVARKYIARLNSSGSLDASFVPPEPDASVDGAIVQGVDRVIVLGDFTRLGTQPNSSYVARLSRDGASDSSFQVYGLGARLTSLLVRGDGQLYAGSATNGLIRFVPTAAPTIVTPPVNFATVPGGSASFGVVAAGTPPLGYQWSWNGVAINGATGTTLALTNAQLANRGPYTVAITNNFGTTTSAPAFVTGTNPLPVITVQPTALSVSSGQNVTLSVAATSVGPLSYQWRRNGAPIAGATANTLNLGGASLTQNGAIFDVLINDELSLVVSQPATVNVTPAAYSQVIGSDPAFNAAFENAGGYPGGFQRLADGRMLVFGSFSRINGTVARSLARLNLDQSVEANFPAALIEGPVYAVAPQLDGKIVIGGAFTRVGGQARAGLARLNADGALDASFVPTGNFLGVYALALQADGKVVLGGGFSPGIARVNASGATDPGFAPFANNVVNALGVQSDGRIVVGGSFTTMSGQPRSCIARLNTDGSVDSGLGAGTGFDGTVWALRILSNNRVLVGGAFINFNGVAVNRIVRLGSSGAIDAGWSAGMGFNYTVYALDVLGDGRILAGGAFGGFNGVLRLAIARLLADGALDTAFTPLTFADAVIAIGGLSDGTVLVGGGFMSLGGSTQFSIARLSTTGATVMPGFSPGLLSPGSVARVALVAGGKHVAAGAFTHVNGVSCTNLARLNGDGSLDSSFPQGSTGPSSAVNDLLVLSDGSFVLAGTFTAFGAISRNRLARIYANGVLDQAFNPGSGPTGTVSRMLAFPDGRLLLFGAGLTGYGGLSRNVLVRANRDGSADSGFDLGAAPTGGSAVTAAVLPDSKVLLAGSFESVGGVARPHLVRLLSTGAVDPAFAVNVDDAVNALLVQPDGRIVLGGDFLAVNDTARARLARLNADGTLDASFNPDFALNGSPRLFVAEPGGRLFVGGSFSAVSTYPAAAYLIRLKANGTLDTGFCAPGLNAAPGALAMLDDGSLLLVGDDLQMTTGPRRFGVLRTVSSAGPTILTPPVGGSVAAGTPIALNALVVGGQDLAYQWLRNGAAIPGATGATYSVASGQAADAGSYTVRLTHSGGSLTTGAATIAVTASAPVFATTAIGGFGNVIKSGSRWSLTAPALAAGTAPVTFQWSKNGGAIAGATNRMFSPPTWQPADSGIYQVIASNSVGPVASAGFQQLVTAAPDWAWRVPSPQGNSLSAAVFLNNRFLAGGARGTIVTSPDGLAWTVSRLGTSNTVLGFAHGNGTFVARSGYSGLWTSTDGVGWTQRESGVGAGENQLTAVAFGAGRFVAVGSGGLVRRSVDGMSWTAAGAGLVDSLYALAYGGGKFVALGAGGRTFVSLDGTAWSAGPTLPRAVQSLAYGAGKFVAATGNWLYVSVDGATWSGRTLATTASIVSLQFTSAGFLAALNSTDGRFWKSSDGMVWTEQNMSLTLLAAASGLTYGANRYAMVGPAPETLLTAADGSSWTRVSAVSPVNFVAAASNATTLVAIAASSQMQILSDGSISYLVPEVSFMAGATDVAFGAGRFVAVGSAGKSAYSSDEATWIRLAPASSADLYGVNFLVDRFYAVGASGTMLSSTDGASWAARSSGTSQSLYKTAFGAGTYVVVGATGTVLSSSDTVTWTARTASGISTTIRDVIFAAGKFVLVSAGGSIRTSPDGITWTAQDNPLDVGLKSLVYAGGRFYAFPDTDTNYLVSDDAVTWIATQHGNANAAADAVAFGNNLYLVGANASIVSLPLTAAVPTIAVQPLASSATITGSTTLAVTVSGTGPFSYQWFKNGAALVGANGATLPLNSLAFADAGSYAVMITNAAGSVTSTAAALTVIALTPPVLDANGQPVSQLVVQGSTAGFAVAANSPANGPLTFRWYFTPVASSTPRALSDLAGKLVGTGTASLTVGNAQAADAGDYVCVVTNGAGSTTSQAALLTVVERLVQIVSQTTEAGLAVVVPIQLVAKGDENAVSFTLEYAPAQLTYTDATIAGTDASTGSLVRNATQAASGKVSLTIAKPAGEVFAAGSRAVVNVTFTVAAGAARGEVLPLAFTDSLVAKSITSAATTTLSGPFLDGSITVASGLEGDLNGDGELDGGDWVKLGRMVVGLDPAPAAGVAFMRADIAPRAARGDGAIEGGDWVQLGRYVVGLDAPQPAGGAAGP